MPGGTGDKIFHLPRQLGHDQLGSPPSNAFELQQQPSVLRLNRLSDLPHCTVSALSAVLGPIPFTVVNFSKNFRSSARKSQSASVPYFPALRRLPDKKCVKVTCSPRFTCNAVTSAAGTSNSYRIGPH